MHDVLIPRQVPLSVHQVPHERVRAVGGAPLDRNVPAVAELVHVVLHAPVYPRLADQVRTNLRGDDLVGPGGESVGDDLAVEVDDHALAHAVEVSVGAAHAHVGGDHQVLERVGLVGEPPGVTNRRGVSGGSYHDLGALVRALAAHLGEHAVVADDQRELATLGPFAHRYAHVPGLPRLHGDPRVQLAVVQHDLPGVVDDQAGVVRVSVGVVFHYREATPDLVLDARSLEGGHLRSLEPTHDLRVGVHRKAV